MNMQASDVEQHIFLGNQRFCHNSSVKRRSFRDESDVCLWNNPCANIGVCQLRPNEPAGFICECYEQFYVGEECILDRLQERNYCEENKNLCLNGGSCKPMWGSYFCECSDEFEGRKCEIEKNGQTTSNGRISQPVFLYDIDAGTTNSCVFLLFFKKKNLGYKFKLEFYLDKLKVFDVHEEDMFLGVPAKWKNLLKSKHLASKFTNDVTYVYHWKIQFFFVNRSLNAGLKLYNNETVQFEDNYFISIARDSGKCVPNLELIDCNTKWRRRHEHVIRSNIDQNCVKLSSKLHYQWMVFGKENDIPHQSTFFFKIPKFSAKPGGYRLQLKVLEVLGKPGRWKSHYNTKSCLFMIETEPLVAIIVGGKERSVGFKHSFVVNASASYNPNEPPNKQHLTFEWSCTPLTGSNICDFERITDSVIYVRANKITTGDRATFTVIIKVLGEVPQKSKQKQTVNVVPYDVPEIMIKCLKNCGHRFKPNVREAIFIEATCINYCADIDDNFYEWDVVCDGTVVTINWETDTVFGKNNPKLGLNENVLEPGRKCDFIVKGGNKVSVSTRMTMNSPPAQGVCLLSPESGVSGTTDFHLSCSGFNDEDEKLTMHYDIFQEMKIQETRQGVLIQYSTTPYLKFKLMEGLKEDGFVSSLTVQVTDYYGMSTDYKLKAKVDPFSETMEEDKLVLRLFELLEDYSDPSSVPNLMARGYISGTIQTILVLCDILVNLKDSPDNNRIKDESKTKLIWSLSQVPVFNLRVVSQLASAVRRLSAVDTLAKDHYLARGVGAILKNLCISFLHFVQSQDNEKYHWAQILELSQNLLNCASDIVSVPAPAKEVIEVDDSDYPFYVDIEPSIVAMRMNFKSGIMNTLEGMIILSQTLSIHLISGEKEVKLHAENISLWLKCDKVKTLSGVILPLGEEMNGVKISEDLATYLDTVSTSMKFQVGIVVKNQFWWQTSGYDIKTGIILFSLVTENNVNISNELPSPIHIYFTTNETQEEDSILTGTLDMSLNWKNDDTLEENIIMHRVEVKSGMALMLVFEPFSDPECKLKVVILLGRRPSVNEFKKSFIVVPSHSPEEKSLIFSQEVSNEDELWFYIGIAPHEDMIEAFSEMKDYSFHLYSLRCQHWKDDIYEWSFNRCQIGHETTTTKMHCSCNHSSIFSGLSLVPPNKIDAFYNVSLIIALNENPLVLVTVILMFIIFLITLLWARRQDKKDLMCRQIILLEDNFVRKKYFYLIMVHTGYKWGAGTSSNVGIQLIGDKYKSVPHILRCTKRKLFKRNSDEWFILPTRKCLGSLHHIQLWHDNTGDTPSWYCNRVVIRDLQTDNEWTFLVYRWFSLTKGDKCIHYTVKEAPEEEIMSFKTLLYENCCFDLGEQHDFLGIALRNPRNPFTRCQRTMGIFVTILLSMLANMMFYGTPKGTPDDLISVGSFEISSSGIIIAVESIFVTVPISFIVFTLFRKTEPYEIQKLLPDDRHYTNLSDEGRLTLTHSYLKDKNYKHASMSHKDNRKKEKKHVYVSRATSLFHTHPSIFSSDIVKEVDNKDRKGIEDKKNDTVKSKKKREPKNKKIKMLNDRSKTGGKSRQYSSIDSDSDDLSYWFPSWFIYIAWVMSSVIAATVMFLLIMYGFSYGKMKSYLWLTSMLISLAIDAFVNEPVKIICIGVLFSSFLKRQPSIMELQSAIIIKPQELQLKRDQKTIQENNVDPLGKQLLIGPLNRKKIQKLQQKECEDLYCSFLIQNVILSAVYLLNLLFIFLYMEDDLIYFSTKCFEDLFLSGVHASLNYSDIRLERDVINYLNSTFIPAVYELMWYNGVEVGEYGWTSDINYYLMGVPRLQQMRFTQVDKQNYSIGWKEFSLREIISLRSMLPWVYRWSSEPPNSTILAYLSLYSGGGYIANFGRTRNNSLTILQFLNEFMWFDEMTQSTKIELTTYNVNHNVFNAISLLMEKERSGIHITYAYINTSLMTLTRDSMDYLCTIPNICITIILLLLLYQQIKRVTNSVWEVWIPQSFLIEMIVVIFLIFWISIFYFRNLLLAELLRDFESIDKNCFINIQTPCYMEVLLRQFAGLLLFLSVTRFWRVLQHFHILVLFERTFMSIVYVLVSIVVIVLILNVALCLFCCSIIHSVPTNLSYIYKSCFSFLLIGPEVSNSCVYKYMTGTEPTTGLMFFFINGAIMALIYMNLFTVTTIVHYREVKQKQNMLNTFIFYRCIKSKLQNYFKRGHVSPTKRLRAGGERNTCNRRVIPHLKPFIIRNKLDSLQNVIKVPQQKLFMMQIVTEEELKFSHAKKFMPKGKETPRLQNMISTVINYLEMENKNRSQENIPADIFYKGFEMSKHKIIHSSKLSHMKSDLQNILSNMFQCTSEIDRLIKTVPYDTKVIDNNITLSINDKEAAFDSLLSLFESYITTTECRRSPHILWNQDYCQLHTPKQRIIITNNKSKKFKDSRRMYEPYMSYENKTKCILSSSSSVKKDNNRCYNQNQHRQKSVAKNTVNFLIPFYLHVSLKNIYYNECTEYNFLKLQQIATSLITNNFKCLLMLGRASRNIRNSFKFCNIQQLQDQSNFSKEYMFHDLFKNTEPDKLLYLYKAHTSHCNIFYTMLQNILLYAVSGTGCKCKVKRLSLDMEFRNVMRVVTQTSVFHQNDVP